MSRTNLLKFARTAMALGSASVIIGGGIIYANFDNFGDALMIGGFVLLVLGVVALTMTQAGESDAE